MRHKASHGIVAVLCLAIVQAAAWAEPVRVKDLGRLNSWRESALVGYGLVTGLAGTGDSPRSKATRQSLANILSRFDLAIASDDIQSRNIAAVMITANLPSYARPGDALDVTVTSVGDARSLAGGSLITAPLKGPDGEVYALATGPLTVGGYRYDANNNQVQKNHPTVGLVSGGATVELAPALGSQAQPDSLTFVLQDADFTTAGRIADAVNVSFGAGSAEVRDAAAIDVRIPASFRQIVPAFIRRFETLAVEPDLRARVVVNERTGTIITGGDVRISNVAVSHGDLRITVTAETTVSQPFLVRQLGGGVRTEAVTNSKLTVDDPDGTKFLRSSGTTVADLIQSLVKLKTSTRDMIAVLQASRRPARCMLS